MIGLDTNVLVRYLTEDDLAQTDTAERYLKAHRSAADPGFVNHVVLCELAWVLDSAYAYRPAHIAQAIAALLDNRDLRLQDEELVRAAPAKFVADRIDVADALLTLVNTTHGCAATATFDKQAARAKGFVLIQ